MSHRHRKPRYSLAFAALTHLLRLICIVGLVGWGAVRASASTAYGDLNNFDVFNDTGQDCHGFEIELDDVHSTDITYTYDWNHYGPPSITEDNSDPAHPKVFVRYAAKYAGGGFSAYTAVPATAPSPTDGHMCTNPSVNFGCEHFGVGYYGTPSAVKYHWLIEDPFAPGNLIKGPAVNVATPSWTYYPPAPQQPVARVQAVILAPPPPPAPVYEFGDAVWVKAIKTTSHNSERVELKDLISDDPDDPDDRNWANGEPDEVEVEWQLLQTEFNNPDGANNDLAGEQEEMPDGDEVVTRRYEFYKYTGPFDPESHEAKCDKYPPVTDPASPKYKPQCIPPTATILGDYIGAQMAGFNVEAVLGLIDHVLDGDLNEPYTARTVVVGGNTPYVTHVTAGALPTGLTIDPATGVLSGTPTAAGEFAFTVTATDADTVQVSKAYTMSVGNPDDLCAGVVCTPSDACHAAGVCDPDTGWCSDPPVADETPCDDGDACTQTDTCQAGVCTGGNPVTCVASDACHLAGACDSATGECSDPPAPDDTPCSNGDGCAADTCQSGICQAASCPAVDVVALPVKPLRVTIPSGKSAVTKMVTIAVRNADSLERTIAVAVDDGDCPAGTAGVPDFVPGTPEVADTSIVVGPGKTKKAKVPVTVRRDDFQSFNLKAPARCRLGVTASALVVGGSNEATPANNEATLEVSVADKNDAQQTAVHESTIKSAHPVHLTISAGQSSAAKTLSAAVGNADYKPVAEKPGDAITVSAVTTCTGLSLSPPVCATGDATATVKGGGTAVCKLTATATASEISTPNQKSPHRCTVTLTASGPDPETAPHDPSNNSTELVIDVVNKNP